ncbi:hypothetical protein AX17_003953 [Amanita inopinata Kibby_2008]|nr:hypothetical protein AX17_003953 [Amanita inopinata Kibby_2008]
MRFSVTSVVATLLLAGLGVAKPAMSHDQVIGHHAYYPTVNNRDLHSRPNLEGARSQSSRFQQHEESYSRPPNSLLPRGPGRNDDPSRGHLDPHQNELPHGPPYANGYGYRSGRYQYEVGVPGPVSDTHWVTAARGPNTPQVIMPIPAHLRPSMLAAQQKDKKKAKMSSQT